MLSATASSFQPHFDTMYSSSEGAHYLFDATLTVVHAKDVEAWFHVYSQGVVGSLTLLHSHPMLMV